MLLLTNKLYLVFHILFYDCCILNMLCNRQGLCHVYFACVFVLSAKSLFGRTLLSNIKYEKTNKVKYISVKLPIINIVYQ